MQFDAPMPDGIITERDSELQQTVRLKNIRDVHRESTMQHIIEEREDKEEDNQEQEKESGGLVALQEVPRKPSIR